MKVIISKAKDGAAVAKTPEGKAMGRRALNWIGATFAKAADELTQTLLSKHPTITIFLGDMPTFKKFEGVLVWSALDEGLSA